MNYKSTIALVTAFCLAIPATANQILAEPWVQWIRSLQPRVTYNGGLWPDQGIVAPACVPQAVWQEQRAWTSAILRPSWVPNNLPAMSTAARFMGDDVLAYRVDAAGWLVQVADDAGGVTILAKPSAGPLGTNQERIRSVLSTISKFPTDKLGELELNIYEKSIGASAGFTFIGSALGSTPRGRASWWQHFQGLSDGRSILIRFAKLDGTQEPIYATEPPAGRLRFNIN
jgi:hypothetical protein